MEELSNLPKLANLGKGNTQIEAQQILAMIADTVDEQVFKLHLVLLGACGTGEKIDKAGRKLFSGALKLCVKTAKELFDTAQKMKKRFPVIGDLESNLSKDIRQQVQDLNDVFVEFLSDEQAPQLRHEITSIVESARKLCRILRTNLASMGSPGRRLTGPAARRSVLSSPSFGTLPVLRAKQDENCSKQGALVLVESLCALMDDFNEEWSAMDEDSRSQFLRGLKIVLDDFNPTRYRSGSSDRIAGRAVKPQPKDLYLQYDRVRQCVYFPAEEEPARPPAPTATTAANTSADSPQRQQQRVLHVALTASCTEFIIGAHNIVWSPLPKDQARKDFLTAAEAFCSTVLEALDEFLQKSSSSSSSSLGGSSSQADISSASTSTGELGPEPVDARIRHEAKSGLEAIVSSIVAGTINHYRAAVADARSVTRRGLLDQQLRRQIWICSNSIRVHGIRVNALLPQMEKPESRIELYCTALTLGKDVKRFLKTVETFMLIQQIETAKSKDGDDDAVKDVDEKNIWMENSKKDPSMFYYASEVEGDPKPTVASLNELILRLTSDINFERDYQDTFITTYRSFTEPVVIFRKMMERFQVPSGLFDRGRTKSIQLRVAVVVTNWMNTNFGDFDQILVNELYRFGEQLRTLGFKSSGDSLLTSLEKKLQYQQSYLHSTLSSPPVYFDVLLTNTYTPSGIIMASSEIEVARQLTLIDYAIFASIELSELLNLNWSSKSRAHRASNIRMMVRRLNQLSHWFSAMILWPTDIAARAKVYTRVLKILVHLRELQNWNAVMGIIAGLNMAAVPRLKKTLALVDPKLLEAFSDIEETMAPSGSYRNYREALSQCQGSVVPYLGVFLTDLTFIEEGNPDDIDGLINFGKRNLIYTILKVIKTFQSNAYPFPPVEPLHSILFALPHVQNDQLMFDLSLAREPREQRPPQQQQQ